MSKEDAEKIAKEALVSQAWPQKKQLGVQGADKKMDPYLINLLSSRPFPKQFQKF